MQKLYAVLILTLIYSSALAQSSNPAKDDPAAARQHDFDITHDPVTNDIPVSRLYPVIDSVNQYFKDHPETKTVANWTERGPNNVGGRTRALLFDPNDLTYKKVWAGGVNGGLWYTNDITVANPTWNVVNNLWANMAVSCIAYAPNNTQTFYVGTGEGYGNSDAARGSGIWKTTDGGSTWSQLPSTANQEKFTYIQKIVVTSTGVVLAGTRGQFCNGDAGILRSTDGGATWTRVLGTSTGACATSSTSCADLEIGPDGTLYASMGISYTGNIYKSVDNGLNWTVIGGNGFPTTGYERIEIAVCPSNANRIYAMCENATGAALLGIYTSTNKGATWTSCTSPSWFDQSCSTPSSDFTRTQSWYDLILAVDPLNENTVFAGGVDIMKSSNTGSSWTQICSWWGGCSRQYVHADQHAIVFRPGSSSIGIFGNDGGVYYSTTLNNAIPTLTGKNNGYNVTQFYSCAIKPNCHEEYLMAGAQDNGTQLFTNAGMNATQDISGGDGGFCFIDQTSASHQVVSYVYNNFYLTTDNWNTYSTILSSNNTIGRFINPSDYDDVNHILYTAYSTSQVSRVSGLTTTPSATEITISGMVNMPTHIRASPYAPAGTSTIFVGNSGGKLFKVTNAHATPTTTDISGTSAPWGTSASISCVEIGATENNLIVTFSNYGVNSVWRTTDGGATWSSKEGNLPDMPIRWALYNPNDLNEVFLATELGIWSTTNVTAASPNWVANNNGLANVRIDMLQLRKSDNLIAAATHGRGLYTSTSFGGGSAAPFPEFSVSNSTPCKGATVNFINNTCGSATSWLWNFSGGTPATSTLQNPSVTYNTAGTYSVTLTATNAFGNNVLTKTAYITVTGPVANAGADKTLTCSAPSSTLGTASVSGNTYAWSPTTGLNSSTLAQPTTTATVTTTYTLTVTSAAGCTATDVVLVTVNKTPPTANAGTDKSLNCTIPSSTLGTAAVSGNTYAWSPATNLSSTTSAQPTASSVATTTYTVTVTTTANGCTATDAVLVSVNKTPPTANAGTDKTLTCTTPSSTIGTASVSGNTYAWSPATNLSSTTSAQPTASSIATTTYTVTVTTTANGCTATDAVLVSVNKTPPTANAGTDKALTCTTPSSTIGTASVSGNTYAWSPATNLSSTTIAQPTASSIATTTYTVTVTTTANGCTATDAVVVSVNKTPPTANAGTDKALTCTTPSSTIGTASVSGNSYAWSPATNLSSTTSAQPTASSIATTTYTVTVTTTANGCTATDAVVVTVNKTPPTANAGVDKTLTCAAPSSTIGTASVSGNTYAWSPATNLNSTTIAQPTATSVNTTTYTVTVTTTANGCTATDAVLVTVVPCNSVLITKLFIQGYYTGLNLMNAALFNQGVAGASNTVADSITVELRNTTLPYTLHATTKTLVGVNGMATCNFPSTSGNYYVVIKHRNSIQTWSANPVAIGPTTNYDFSTAASQAYGANQIFVGNGQYAMYGGDVNQDLTIDAFDYLLQDPDIVIGASGYVDTDLTGDGFVDAFDYILLDANLIFGVSAITP
jgi:PKD repeat protein